MLLAVLEKRIGYHLANQDVFLNVVGGLTVDDPAADLAICAAVISSLKNKSIDPHIVLCGEVGLTGEIRSISHFSLRASEAKNLGFKRILAPKSVRADVDGIEIVTVESVKEALAVLSERPPSKQD